MISLAGEKYSGSFIFFKREISGRLKLVGKLCCQTQAVGNASLPKWIGRYSEAAEVSNVRVAEGRSESFGVTEKLRGKYANLCARSNFARHVWPEASR